MEFYIIIIAANTLPDNMRFTQKIKNILCFLTVDCMLLKTQNFARSSTTRPRMRTGSAAQERRE